MEKSRRQFIRWSGKTLAVASLFGLAQCSKDSVSASTEKPTVEKAGQPNSVPSAQKKTPTGVLADLPKAKGPRVVVVGAGVSGLTVAKYLKKEHPAFDVVLVDKRAMYACCFATALWYAGEIPMDMIAGYSFYDAARHGGYWYFQAVCTGLDRIGKRVVTDQGEIPYDYLVIAPGIDYDYAKIGVTDTETRMLLEQHFPAGFNSPVEFAAVKNKLAQFEKGVFVQTVPAGNYRCFASPFERACVLAALLKKQKRAGKVLLLDASPEIRIKKDGFEAAFKQLYGGLIEYVPSVNITAVDPVAKTIETEFDSYTFDDACIYPPVRGARLLETLGLADPHSPQNEARIDPLTNHLPDDDTVYVTGDSRPMPFSKSANTAYTEGRHVARRIAAKVNHKTIAWESPTTKCFSIVSLQPLMGISVRTQYAYNRKTKAFGFAHSQADEQRDQAKAQAVKDWTMQLHRDLFGES